MKHYKKTIIIIATSTLFGCGGEDKINEIEKEIAQKKQLYMTEIEPLPSFDDVISYRYQNTEYSSPFNVVPFVPIVKKVVNNSMAPDTDREKEYLEKFQLQSIKMQGYIKSGSSMKAIVKDPIGGFHQVIVGDYIGKNYGKIAKITKDEIIVEELINQAESGWVEEKNSITKQKNKDNGFEDAQIENIKKMNR